jgi:hypothetical protein
MKFESKAKPATANKEPLCWKSPSTKKLVGKMWDRGLFSLKDIIASEQKRSATTAKSYQDDDVKKRHEKAILTKRSNVRQRKARLSA